MNEQKLAVIKNGKSSEQVLEIYKIYIEMMDRITARRIETNKFYVSIITALLVIVPIMISQDFLIHIKRILFFLYGLIGLSLCFIWFVNIRSYKDLNRLKFHVIHEIEEYLDFSCYKREWEILNKGIGFKYQRISRIELYIPLLFSIPYIVILYSIFIYF